MSHFNVSFKSNNILSISFIIFLIGLVLGGGSVYYLLNISTPISATMKITSSNPKANISDEKLTVESKRKLVEVNTSFTTDKKGTFTNTITINRRNLQFRHSIYADTSYLFTSQTFLFSVAYSYKWLLLSTKLGYSFTLQKIDYGFGIGVKYSF